MLGVNSTCSSILCLCLRSVTVYLWCPSVRVDELWVVGYKEVWFPPQLRVVRAFRSNLEEVGDKRSLQSHSSSYMLHGSRSIHGASSFRAKRYLSTDDPSQQSGAADSQRAGKELHRANTISGPIDSDRSFSAHAAEATDNVFPGLPTILVANPKGNSVTTTLGNPTTNADVHEQLPETSL